jgi:hypothetical protein
VLVKCSGEVKTGKGRRSALRPKKNGKKNKDEKRNIDNQGFTWGLSGVS